MADGVHSSTRSRFADAFRPTITEGANRFSWLASDRPFDKLSILLSESSPALLGWAYKYTAERSTFIVECTEEAYRNNDLATLAPTDTCTLLNRIFDPVLHGSHILSEPIIRWSRYPVLNCERLTHGNVVLVGDAGHTTHFSQGFGTMFAFDDALSLAEALNTQDSISGALTLYEETQQHKIGEFQKTAGLSMQWSERLLSAAGIKDGAAVQDLIEARWPNNQVTSSPLTGKPANQ
ncbi:MAG: FAD-dependent monooxygenase [Acidimicrobiales bacterium]